MSELLPPNSSELERAAATVGAAATDLPVIIRDLWHPESCPARLLPWLAWAWSVDDWSDDWSDRQKRNTIASALEVQKHKGTIGSVRQALGSIGFRSRVQEWFNQTPEGAPYTFKLYVDVDQDPVDQSGILKVLDIVDRNKSLRSALETVIQQVTSRSGLTVATVTTAGHDLGLDYDAPEYSDGTIAWDLMTDAAYNGEQSTLSAIQNLHDTIHLTMSANNYW